MGNKQNILQELSELNSCLAASVAANPYVVPAGYFDGLATCVLRSIKAIDATNASEELAILSPAVSAISKNNPYQIPKGYFEENITNIGFVTIDNLSAGEELKNISPLLKGLQKQSTYKIPDNYFEQLGNVSDSNAEKPGAKVVSLGNPRWLKWAAAAVVSGVLLLAGINFYHSKKADPIASVAKASDSELREVLELSDKSTESSTANGEIPKDLLKDISDEELKNFLTETSNADVDEESLIYN